jgi:hypothetical protein
MKVDVVGEKTPTTASDGCGSFYSNISDGRLYVEHT